MRLPHIWHFAAFFAYFNKVSISHIFPHILTWNWLRHFLAVFCFTLLLHGMFAASCMTVLGALSAVITFQLAWSRSYSDITFAAAGPHLWNSLPVQLRNPDITYWLFRRPLIWRDIFFSGSRNTALRLPICNALDKHFLTYIHTYLLIFREL